MMVSSQGDHGDERSGEVAKKKINGGNSRSSIDEELKAVFKVKEISESASQKHAFSERKRRKRINGHYDSLRQFFPQLVKTDKASVLMETVRRLKELKGMVADITQRHEGMVADITRHDNRDRWSINRLPLSFFIPGENNEVTICCDYGDTRTVLAIICCEDRPDLNKGLTDAIQSVRGKAVKAKMATVGGRTKVEVVVEWPEFVTVGEEDVQLLRRELKAVVDNRVLGQTRLTGRGLTEPEFTGLSRRSTDGGRPILHDQIENRLADGLIVRSY